MSTRRLQPLDVVTGAVSATLATTFFVLAALAAAPDDEPAPVVVDSAVTAQR